MTVLTGHSERVAEDPGPAAELAPMVEVWFRILGDHVPDEDRRCRACSGVRRAAVAVPGAGDWPSGPASGTRWGCPAAAGDCPACAARPAR